MKKIAKIRLINLVVWVILISLLIYFGITSYNGTYTAGGARGVLIGLAAILLGVFPCLTVYYVRKNKGDWGKVADALKHNYLALISVKWWGTKR